MKTSIITVTYDKDLEYLKYNLKFIQKFCKGYHDNIVIIDDHENDCVETQNYLDSIGQKYFVNSEAKHVNKGYIRQQYIKLFSDQYVSDDTEYICHVDTDNIFTSPHDPSVYFKDGLPIVGIQKWTDMSNNKFKQYTDNTVGFKSVYNFMRRMPLIYHKDLFESLRSCIESNHGDIIEYLNTLETFSEYNTLGAFAYMFQRDRYYWVDVINQKALWSELTVPCTQYSNREYTQPHRYVDLSDDNNAIKKILNDGD